MGSMLRERFQAANAIAFSPSQVQAQSLNLPHPGEAILWVHSASPNFQPVILGQPTNPVATSQCLILFSQSSYSNISLSQLQRSQNDRGYTDIQTIAYTFTV